MKRLTVILAILAAGAASAFAQTPQATPQPHQVKIYTPDEPDFLSVNCDEFGCGPGLSSKRAPRATTIRTPTGGGGFVERTYN